MFCFDVWTFVTLAAAWVFFAVLFFGVGYMEGWHRPYDD
jgi:hypothetical protein